MFILSDELLSKLICSVCSKYLSVKPIKIYRNRAIKCGRCSKDDDGGIVSMYEKMAENGLFPCINRYEGCTELLAYSAVADHEKECFSTHYNCPICSSKFSSYHIIQHYKKEHSNALLEQPEIVLNKKDEYENYYMYKENDNIYILYVRCNLADNCYFVNAACLGHPERVHRIKQDVKCYLGNAINSDNSFLHTEQRDCSLIENNSEYFKIPFSNNANLVIVLKFCFDTTSVKFINFISNNTIGSIRNTNGATTAVVGLNYNKYPKLFLSEEFKKMYQACSVFNIDISVVELPVLIGFPRSCSFCENILTISDYNCLYKCDKENHFYCDSCWAIVPVCYLSKTPRKIFVANVETHIYRLLQFYCRFNCGKLLFSHELSNHEDVCIKNDCLQKLPNDFNLFLINGKTHFGSRSNVFLFKKYGFKNGETIFVTTRDYFKFVLHSHYEKYQHTFWVSHGYPKAEYTVEFKFVSCEEIIYTDTLDLFDDDILGFAVFLRKSK